MADQRSAIKYLLAWGVHAYTALGLVAAAAMAVLIVRGGAESFRWCFVLMLAATLIDASDGLLARAARVKEVLPGFDGRRLDDLVDFLNYTALPLLLIWRAEILPAGQEAWLLVPLVASAYGFCQVAVKTDDGYFLGFPSYWNLVAFYLYLMHHYLVPLPGWFSIGLLVGLALLTFVPIRYLYLSQKGMLNALTNALAAVWVAVVLWILYCWPTPDGATDGGSRLRPWVLLSLIFPVYYMLVSWIVGARLWYTTKTNAPGRSNATGTTEGGCARTAPRGNRQ